MFLICCMKYFSFKFAPEPCIGQRCMTDSLVAIGYARNCEVALSVSHVSHHTTAMHYQLHYERQREGDCIRHRHTTVGNRGGTLDHAAGS